MLTWDAIVIAGPIHFSYCYTIVTLFLCGKARQLSNIDIRGCLLKNVYLLVSIRKAERERETES